MVKNLIYISFIAFSIFSGNAWSQTNFNLIDERAKQYFSQEEINNLPPYRIEQINYLFRESFKIDTETKPCTICPAIDASQIDIRKFNRDQNFPTRHYLSNPGHAILIYPWVVVKKQLAEIENKYKQ